MRIATSLRLAFVLLVSGLLQSTAYAHGGAATIDKDPCAHSVKGAWLHYSMYQPQHDQKAEYCQELPLVGPTILVIDIVDKQLRQQSLGLRVDAIGDDGVATPILTRPAQLNPSGVIDAEVKFDEPGRYIVSLTSPSDPDRIDQLHVAVAVIEWQKLAQRYLPLALMVGLIGWLAWRAKRWFVGRRAHTKR